jgi:hypothetical protein
VPTLTRPRPRVTLRMSPALLRRLAAVSMASEASDLMNAADSVARGAVHEVEGNQTSEGMKYTLVYEPGGR